MSPRARRVAHEALDLFLDALSEDAREAARPKRRRAPVPLVDLSKVDELTKRRAAEALQKLRARGG